jgi:hypothetical protein
MPPESPEALIAQLSETFDLLNEKLAFRPDFFAAPVGKRGRGRPKGSRIKGDALPLIRIAVQLAARRSPSFAAAVRAVAPAVGNSPSAIERRMRRKYREYEPWLSSVAKLALDLERLSAAISPQVVDGERFADSLRSFAGMLGIIVRTGQE